jgi:hypothetical protein
MTFNVALFIRNPGTRQWTIQACKDANVADVAVMRDRRSADEDVQTVLKCGAEVAIVEVDEESDYVLIRALLHKLVLVGVIGGDPNELNKIAPEKDFARISPLSGPAQGVPIGKFLHTCRSALPADETVEAS